MPVSQRLCQMPPHPNVAALIATHRREQLLMERALPSVMSQTWLPARVVVVDDGATLSGQTVSTLGRCTELAVDLLRLDPAGGAAAAWNAGLRHLAAIEFDGFVAMLDDDDCWDADHLEANVRVAVAEGADIVVSGLRLWVGGRVVPRPVIDDLTPSMFLTGNPGWQGSNTFVSLSAMSRAGGFRAGLPSLNDRDLALRLLALPGVCVGFTGRWTSTWFADTPGALSEPGSVPKVRGLAAFWRIYAPTMSPAEKEAFFQRAERLFVVPRAAVLAMADQIDLTAMLGVHHAPLE